MISVRWRAELGLALAAMMWGGTFVVVKDALRDVSPILYLAIRFGLAAAIMPLFLWTGLRAPPDRRTLLGGAATGLLLGLGMILQTIGLKFTSASNSGFLTALYIVLVPFVSALVYRVRPARWEIAAVLTVIVGIALMSLDPGSLTMNIGDLLTVGCGVVFAFQIVMVTHFSKAGNFAWLAWLQVSVTAFLCALAVLAGFDGVAFLTSTPRLAWAFVITVFGATVLAFILQSWGQANTSATRAALIFATEPVFAGVASYFYLGERFAPGAWFGAFLILAGILLMEMKPASKPEHNSN